MLEDLKLVRPPHSPRAIVEIKTMAAGQSTELTFRLPAKAMRMTRPGETEVTAFTHLFAALDFTNTVAETDESNNVAVVERTALDR